MMSGERLKDAISILYDMEKNNYLMERAIEKLDCQIADLGLVRNIRPPQKENICYDPGYAALLIPFGIAGGVIGAIYGLVTLFTSSFDFLVILFNIIFTPLVCGVIGALIGGAIGALIGLLYAVYYKNKEIKRAEREYQEACVRYKREKQNDKIRMERELRQKDLLSEQRTLLYHKLYDSHVVLSSFYNAVGIDGDFRDIIHIGYMYDFARLGIATELQGTNGLYDRVRKDIREELLRLDVKRILQRLDQIIDKQDRIYSDIHRLNDRCDQMLLQSINISKSLSQTNQRLEELSVQTELSEYRLQRIQREEEYRTFLLLY